MVNNDVPESSNRAKNIAQAVVQSLKFVANIWTLFALGIIIAERHWPVVGFCRPSDIGCEMVPRLLFESKLVLLGLHSLAVLFLLDILSDLVPDKMSWYFRTKLDSLKIVISALIGAFLLLQMKRLGVHGAERFYVLSGSLFITAAFSGLAYREIRHSSSLRRLVWIAPVVFLGFKYFRPTPVARHDSQEWTLNSSKMEDLAPSDRRWFGGNGPLMLAVFESPECSVSKRFVPSAIDLCRAASIPVVRRVIPLGASHPRTIEFKKYALSVVAPSVNIDTLSTLLDGDQIASKRYNISGTPTFIMIEGGKGYDVDINWLFWFLSSRV